MGEPDNSVSQARTAMGTEGVGFWFRGVNNYVRNNVAANFQNETVEAAYGFVYQLRMLGNIAQPRTSRARTRRVGTVHDEERQQHPDSAVREQRGLRRDAGRIHLWWIGGQDPTPYSNAQESVIKESDGLEYLQQVRVHLPERADHVRWPEDSG